MSVFDELPALMAEAFGEEFSSAVLIVPVPGVSDGQGGYEDRQPQKYACKAMITNYSDQRVAAGIPVNDRKIIVLAATLAGDITPGDIVPAVGMEIQVAAKAGRAVEPTDRRWSIMNVDRDPASATYELQAR